MLEGIYGFFVFWTFQSTVQIDEMLTVSHVLCIVFRIMETGSTDEGICEREYRPKYGDIWSNILDEDY